jgi:hypothetical protein
LTINHLYVLRRKTDQPKYDAVFGFVIRAHSPDAARVIASGAHADEGQHVWEDPALSSCHELTTNGAVGIIMRDFNAG